MLERQHRLQDAAEARGRLHVADVGLDRADEQPLGTRLREHLADRRRLDRIADRRAGAVRLDEGEPVGIETLLDVELVQELGLEGLRRQRDAVGAPVGVGVRADDEAVDWIAVTLGRLARAQHQHDAALCAHVAVGVLREGLAQPAARQHRGLREADEGMRRDEQVDAADDRRVDAPGAQVDDRLVESDQRRRAGGIDREARSVQVEDVGDAVRDDRQRVAGHHVGVGRRDIDDAQVDLVDRGRADEHAGVGPGDARRPDAGVLQRFPDELQQQALLRVHLLRLARRQTEHRGIETPDVVEDAGGPGIGASGLAARMDQPVQRPAIGGDLRDRTAPFR